MITKIKAQNAIFLEDKQENEAQRPFKARFLQAGLVKYDFGVCLLKKETIDKFIDTFIECPVIINHQDKIADENKKGEIKDIWFSDADGWFWCSGFVDEDAAELVEQGYNVSCQYKITEYANNTENRLHNGNPYDKEILNGVFEHLAIIENPRYEDAYIAVNAIIAADKKEEAKEANSTDRFFTKKRLKEDKTASNSLYNTVSEHLYSALNAGLDDALGEQ